MGVFFPVGLVTERVESMEIHPKESERHHCGLRFPRTRLEVNDGSIHRNEASFVSRKGPSMVRDIGDKKRGFETGRKKKDMLTVDKLYAYISYNCVKKIECFCEQ